MPFQDVDIQQMPRGEGTVAEGAGISVHHVVVVLVVFYGGKHLATASNLTGELRHPGKGGVSLGRMSPPPPNYPKAIPVGLPIHIPPEPETSTELLAPPQTLLID